MSRWKCEICDKEFDNFHAQGFDNKIYCPLCYFKEKNRQLKQQGSKAIEFIKKYKEEWYEYEEVQKDMDQLLKILGESYEQKS